MANKQTDNPTLPAKDKNIAHISGRGTRLRKKALILAIDVLSVFFSFIFIGWWIPANIYNVFSRYGYPFLAFITVWVITGLLFDKYNFHRTRAGLMVILQIILSNFVVLGIFTTLMYFYARVDFSRYVVIGTVFLSTALEIFYTWIGAYLNRQNRSSFLFEGEAPKTDEIQASAPPRHEPVANMPEIGLHSLQQAITEEAGEEVYQFIASQFPEGRGAILVLSTTTRFNVINQPSNFYHSIINLKRINDIQYINKFFEAINEKIPYGGIFIGCAETYVLRKERILRKYPPVLNWIVYSLDYLIKRIFPKLAFTKKIYFFFTRGHNRVISMAETLGRLSSCGFEIKDDRFVGGLLWFVGKKIKEPAFDYHPTYGPLIRLKRFGKNKKIIGVYKMRTMHAYSEYLQQYVYEKNALQEGGKFADDFRITTIGKIMRKLWLDELPMIINLLKGDMKLVGVRPLSRHYYSLYTPEMQELRSKYRPGLIPPFYADMPKTLEEIMESEKRYLLAYSRNPFITDFVYFWKALYNILFKKARSQ